MQKVIFDSSFLMAVAENPTSWEGDIASALGNYRPVLLECVKNELAKMSSRVGRRARSARVALNLVENFSTHPCGEGNVDDEIVSSALSEGAAVATVDRRLLQSLAASHVKVITLRNGRTWVT